MTKTVTVYEFLKFTEGERFDPDDWVLAAVRGLGSKTTNVTKLTAPDLVDILKNLPKHQRDQVLDGIRAEPHVEVGPKQGPWFYQMGAKEVAEKLRSRCRVAHAKAVDPDKLERVIPVLLAARPFFMFPDSFSPTDITDLTVRCREVAGAEDYWKFSQRVTELFHPDMNYPDIERALKEILCSYTELREAADGMSPWFKNIVNRCSEALWVYRQTQLEKDMAAEDVALTEAEHAAGIHVPPLAPEPSPAPTRDYWSTAVALWTMLDEISTLSDSFKPSTIGGLKQYYDKSQLIVAERHRLLESDGYTLRMPGGDHVVPNTSALPVKKDQEPVPMLLYCPMCHTKHIDEGEFKTRVHHTHACQGRSSDGRRCGHVWRPAIVPTVGVEALPGFINEP